MAGVGLVGVWEGLGERRRIKSPTPLPQLQATEAWEGGCLLSLPCVLQMCQNGGGWEGRGGGEGAWQSGPQGGSLKAIQFLLPGGRQDRGEGWVGDLGVPCVQLCIIRGVLCLVPAVGVYVCVILPFPMPCMTCDAADTTILCAEVCWGH